VIVAPKEVILPSQRGDPYAQVSDCSSPKGDFKLEKSSISKPFPLTNTEQVNKGKNTEAGLM